MDEKHEYTVKVGDDGAGFLAASVIAPPGEYRVTVERIEPEVPTRVVAKVSVTDYDDKIAYDLPKEWPYGEDVTVILGRDELPEKVAYGAAWYLTLGEGNSPVCSHAYAMAEFIRTRWPEAFK